jgi:hypothetical protein
MMENEIRKLRSTPKINVKIINISKLFNNTSYTTMAKFLQPKKVYFGDSFWNCDLKNFCIILGESKPTLFKYMLKTFIPTFSAEIFRFNVRTGKNVVPILSTNYKHKSMTVYGGTTAYFPAFCEQHGFIENGKNYYMLSTW